MFDGDSAESLANWASLFIIPVLGKIADANYDNRQLASGLFGELVRLVPLKTNKFDPATVPECVQRELQEANEFLSFFLGTSPDLLGEASLQRALAMPHYEIPVTINAELRPYQQAGVNWLAYLTRYGLNGALCDDMGLGKTLQTIVILASIHDKIENTKNNKKVTSLVICPASLVGHWHHEITKYAPSLEEPLLYVGCPAERRIIWQRANFVRIVITSYETLRSDIHILDKVDWTFLVLDEGHVIKNPKTKLTLAVKSLRAEHRLLLSGTPIQNNIVELWSLFDFLMPDMLGSEQKFMERYGRAIMAVQPSMNSTGNSGVGVEEFEEAERKLHALHKQVLPFILRRMKEDVLKELPPKIIQDYECDPSAIQRLLCDMMERQLDVDKLERESLEFEKIEGKKKSHIFQVLQYLRKVCVHPSLVLMEDHPLMSKVQELMGSMGIESLDDLAAAPKLVLLKELLTECGIGEESCENVEEYEPAHRVLLFAQQKSTLNLVEKLVLKAHMPKTRYLRLDGSVDQRDRFFIAQRFNTDPSIAILLLTTSVGGLGLNLTGADTVVFLEHDWNPMRDLQAMDRAHRLGQKKTVTVYRLILRNTLEQKVMSLQRWKRRVAATVVQQQNLKGEGHEKAISAGLLDLLAETSEEPKIKKARKEETSSTDENMSKWLVKHGALAVTEDDINADSTLDEYAQAFDMASFLKTVNN